VRNEVITEPQKDFNPFPGLRSFEQDEHHLFFGREEQTGELLKKLSTHRFLGVVGTSGSGKSSLVRAGLLPKLRAGFMVNAGSNWRMAVLRPGTAPIENLAKAIGESGLLGKGERANDPDLNLLITVIDTTLRRGALGLVQLVQQAELPLTTNVLIVIDQFEELFRYKESHEDASEEAIAFVKLLLETAKHPGVSVYVVLTMRSEFLGKCAQFRDLPETINDSQYLIPRMTRDQLRLAIKGPIELGEADISPRLVNRLLNDTG
jgi:energy-coupling factor transporter ATP-binding protein EcfA2